MQLKKIKKISIIIPVYNEQENLSILIRRTIYVCSKLHIKYEIMIIDDGSYDQSPNILESEASKPNSSIIAIFLNKNYGQHAAIMAGFAHSKGDLIITLDADLQNPPEEIPKLLYAAQKGYDVIGTFRMNRQDNLFRKISSKIVNIAIQKILGNNMTDYGCMLRAYQKHIIDAIIKYNSHNVFIPIIANMFAKKVIEIPVLHFKRKFGHSKYNYIKLIKLIYNLCFCLFINITKKEKIFKQISFKISYYVVFLLSCIYLFLVKTRFYINIFLINYLIFIGIKKIFIKIYNKIYLRPIYVISRIIKNDISNTREKE